MTIALAIHWSTLVLRGMVGILLGILTLGWPGIAPMALLFLFAGYALIDGMFSMIGALGERILDGLRGLMVVLGLRRRSWRRRSTVGEPTPAQAQ
jgi:uncharacterized membrane protein HdeD (DUF308 family)